MKTCKTCAGSFPADVFRLVKPKGRNPYYRAHCRDCENTKTAERFQRKGNDWKSRTKEARQAEHRRDAERKGRTYTTIDEMRLRAQADKDNRQWNLAHPKRGPDHPSYKHGMKGTSEWEAWQSMKKRCLNPNHPKYRLYGGSGIGIHAPWIESFQAIYDYVGPKPTDGRYELDRIDPYGDYEPGNVRWWPAGRGARRTPAQDIARQVVEANPTARVQTIAKLARVSLPTASKARRDVLATLARKAALAANDNVQAAPTAKAA